MPYLVYSIESRINAGLPRLEKNIPISQPYRATSFSGSTSQAVAIYASPPGCLKVIDPQVDARLPQKPNFVAEVLPLSDPSRILPDPALPAQPPAEIFGPEPEHGWCYFFEKADLARQMGDWQQVVDLGKQAFKLNERLYEVNAPELVPYIEGYAHTGQWDKAVELTMESQKLTFRMQRMLCATWSRIQGSTAQSEAKQTALSTVQAELGCPTP
jgi:hypothetical protein